MKTIRELNSRTWYRLLKVIYLLAYTVVVVVGLFLSITENGK